MKWTLNTYQVGQNWELDQLIEMCLKTGYPYIEFLMDFDQPHGLEWDAPEARFAEVKEKIEAAGLKFGSFTSCQRFDSPDAEERAESVTWPASSAAITCGCWATGCRRRRARGPRW